MHFSQPSLSDRTAILQSAFLAGPDNILSEMGLYVKLCAGKEVDQSNENSGGCYWINFIVYCMDWR